MDKYTRILLVKFIDLNSEIKLIDFDNRAIDILKSRLHKAETFYNLARKYSISSARAEQIYSECIQQIINYVINILGIYHQNKEVFSEYRTLQQQVINYKSKLNQPFMTRAIAEFDFETRAVNSFAEIGIKTLDELVQWKESELLAVKYKIGKRTIFFIKQELAKYGLQLKPE